MQRLIHPQPYIGQMNTIPYWAGWNTAAALIACEKRQLLEEGRDPKWIAGAWGGVDLEKSDGKTLADLWNRLQEAPMRSEFEFVEPSDLKEIQSARTDAKRALTIAYDDAELYQRMLGAWTGRCVGCALGKPVEGFMGPYNGLSSKDRQKTYLLGIAADEYPLRDYFPGKSPAQKKTGGLWCPASQRENIQFMETDDDIRYTVIGHDLLRQKGANFTSKDVMVGWLQNLPYKYVCTAETQAYRNFVLRYQVHDGVTAEIDWTWVATHQNPYREWIGAQIRADAWGYAAPGQPELAAEFAWRDARISHIKNGIYGEMFVAAMIAAGFARNDPLAVVRAGLAEIPKHSRLHREMEQVIAICQKHGCSFGAFESVLDEVYALLGHYDPVHTNNNAGLVVAALLLGKDDFEKVVTLAVMGGWDTDCNGASAGSIYGAMFGADKIPAKWKEPLQDTLYSQIFNYHPIAISECARQSVEIVQKIRG
jgi:ADP-ribosylglycohydrolase